MLVVRTLHGLMASGPGPDQGSALLGARWCTASSPDCSEMDRVLMVTSSFGAAKRRIGWWIALKIRILVSITI